MDGARPLRVIHTPYNIAGQSACLAAAERQLGLDSRNVVLFETGSGFTADEALGASEHDLVAVEKARWTLLRRAMQADVIHYSFGRSILMPNAYPDLTDLLHTPPWRWPRRLYARAVWFQDVRLLKAMGKTIIVTWQGDDARQGDVLRRLSRSPVVEAAGYYSVKTDAWKRRIIAFWSSHADRQYFLNPDLGHVLPPDARFLPYASFDPTAVEPAFPAENPAQPLTIVHAPSHRGVKGTRHVLDAIATLEVEGASIRFVTVEGLSRDAALARYREADVIIDQLMIGWYGGLAVEAMALGKPVICHIEAGDLAFIPAAMAGACPLIRATPETLVRELRALLAMPRAQLRSLGEESRRYAGKWHNPASIAAKLAQDYRDLRASA